MILKCKICGGDIVLTGQTHGICDSCGCEVTLPKIDSEKRAKLYEQGDYYRKQGDFDRAYSYFHRIVAMDRHDAEAHWCLTLCRFGVEYVKDTRTEEYKPTVSRMSYESIWEDPDYLKALESSDEATKAIYRREAGKIAWIQDRYKEICRKEKPYDVFICFKAENPDGSRTRASEIAQEAYEKLTDKGVRTFFSRITLEDKLGEDYEPYIFAALYSSKIMIVVANEADQLEARWVKNEWTRFLSMQDNDSSKQIVPVFEKMSPNDFPPQIPMRQGVNMGNVGAMQDLVRGVLTILGREEISKVVIKEIGSEVKAANLIKRCQQEMEDKEYGEASKLASQAMEMAPEYGEAHYYLLLSKNRVNDPAKLIDRGVDCEEDILFKNAMTYGSEARKAELRQVLDLYEKEQQYNLYIQYMKQELYGKAVRGFQTIEDYRDSKEKIEECLDLAEKKREAKERREEQERQRRLKEEERKEKERLAKIERELLEEKAKDPTKYLRSEVQRRDREKYEQYAELYREVIKHKKSGFRNVPVCVVLFIISILGAILFGGFVLEKARPLWGGLLWLFAFILMWSEHEGEIDPPMDLDELLLNLMASVFYGIIPCAIVAVICHIFEIYKWIGILLLVITVAYTVKLTMDTLKGGKWRKASKKCGIYHRDNILPIVETVKKEWQGIKDAPKAPEGKNIWDAWDNKLKMREVLEEEK